MANKAMSMVWTKHLSTPEQKEQFEKTVRASGTLIERLLKILDEEEAAINKTQMSVDEFEHPSWSHKQAFILGQRERIQKLRSLFDFYKGKE